MSGFAALTLIDAPTNAAATSRVLSCNEERTALFQFDGKSTGTPVMVIKFWGSVDYDAIRVDQRNPSNLGPGLGTARWTQLNIPEQAVHGSGYTPFSDVADHIDWDGSTDLNMVVDLDGPPLYMACTVSRTSGGSASAHKLVVLGSAKGRGN